MFFPYAEFLQTYDNDNSSFTMFDIDRITAEGPSAGFDQDVVGLSQMRGAPPPWSQDPPDATQQTPDATGRPERAVRSPARHTYSVDHVNAQRRSKRSRRPRGG